MRCVLQRLLREYSEINYFIGRTLFAFFFYVYIIAKKDFTNDAVCCYKKFFLTVVSNIFLLSVENDSFKGNITFEIIAIFGQNFSEYHEISLLCGERLESGQQYMVRIPQKVILCLNYLYVLCIKILINN